MVGVGPTSNSVDKDPMRSFVLVRAAASVEPVLLLVALLGQGVIPGLCWATSSTVPALTLLTGGSPSTDILVLD